jgi:hypothetical protein
MGHDALSLLVSPAVSSSWQSSLTINYSYGLSLTDGNDSMGELEQVSKQIFMREGKVYGKWRQLYPALLHLYVAPV